MDDRRWANARRVLCVRLDTIGDVLMTTPALNALKEAVPGRHLTLLTSPSGARAARLVPVLDEIIEFDAPWMKPPRADVAKEIAQLWGDAPGERDTTEVARPPGRARRVGPHLAA